MFLGAFERVFKGLQKTGLNRSIPVNVNRFFCGLYISKKKRPDLRSGLLRSWSSLVTVFFRSRDRTSKHYPPLQTTPAAQNTSTTQSTITCKDDHEWQTTASAQQATSTTQQQQQLPTMAVERPGHTNSNDRHTHGPRAQWVSRHMSQLVTLQRHDTD